jgi:phage FluMu protein Com
MMSAAAGGIAHRNNRRAARSRFAGKIGHVMPHRKSKLPIIDEPNKRASILVLKLHPAFTSTDSEDLLCGSCGVVLAQGTSRATIQAHFAAPVQLLVKCPKCGTYNRLPAQVGN